VLWIINGPLVRELREELGLSQQDLAKRAKVHVRTILNIENGHTKAVTSNTILGFAREFRRAPEDVIITRVTAWDEVPRVKNKRDRGILSTAVHEDMEGNHAKAIELCERVNRRALDTDDRRGYEDTTVLLATFLDHAGRHKESLQKCEQLLADGKTSTSCRQWAGHHRGIALRRLGSLSEARAAFEQILQERGRHLASTRHQLGVVALEEARLEEGPRRRVRLDEAESTFKIAIGEWRNIAGRLTARGYHRVAHSHRRLGHVYTELGDLRAALEQLLQAHQLFAWHHTSRYVEAVRREICDLMMRSSTQSVEQLGRAPGGPAPVDEPDPTPPRSWTRSQRGPRGRRRPAPTPLNPP
jgi:transcriptional regulator with XRE-family HTH domain